MLYKWIGIGFVGLAALGALLPLLPTTPFLILAAACFARSSERWHKWLLQNPQFGPLIHQWQTERTIPLRSKILALSMITVFGGYSIFFAIKILWLQIVGGVIIAYGIWFVATIKTRPSKQAGSSPELSKEDTSEERGQSSDDPLVAESSKTSSPE